MRLKEYRIPPARWESAKLEPTACPDSVIVPYKHPPAPRPALTSKRAAQRRGPEIEPCNGPLQRNRPPQERERLRRRGGEGTAVESSGEGSIDRHPDLDSHETMTRPNKHGGQRSEKDRMDRAPVHSMVQWRVSHAEEGVRRRQIRWRTTLELTQAVSGPDRRGGGKQVASAK